MNKNPKDKLTEVVNGLQDLLNCVYNAEEAKQAHEEQVQALEKRHQALEKRNQELQTQLDFTIATFHHNRLLITHLCLWHGEHSKHISVEGNREFLKRLGVPEEVAAKYNVGVE